MPQWSHSLRFDTIRPSHVLNLYGSQCGNKVAHDQLASRFPKLFLLRNMLQGYPQKTSHPRTEQDLTLESSTCNRDAWLKLTEGLVQFPKKPDLIIFCQEAVYAFGVTLHNAFNTPIARWKAEVQAQSISPADISAIKAAHDFAVSNSSLFERLVEESPCKTTHWADIHLSGFAEDHINTSIRTCYGIRNLSIYFPRFAYFSLHFAFGETHCQLTVAAPLIRVTHSACRRTRFARRHPWDQTLRMK
jgi:hypothetical protein